MTGRLKRWWERFQPWPFYRKPHFSEATQRAADEAERMIAAGYNPRKDPESPYYEGRTESRNPKPTKVDYGKTKYSLVEMPDYLRGRARMARRGADLAELDYVVGTLLRGYRLPKGCRPHGLKGGMRGQMECHIRGYRNDWVLIYRYDRKDLVLYALDTGTHKECGVDRGRERIPAAPRRISAVSGSERSLAERQRF